MHRPVCPTAMTALGPVHSGGSLDHRTPPPPPPTYTTSPPTRHGREQPNRRQLVPINAMQRHKQRPRGRTRMGGGGYAS